jgi:uncharacterized cupredoxin-like copper-binding protein
MYSMKRILAAAVLMAASFGAAQATGTHAGGHGDEAGTMAIGKPGTAKQAKRTVNITMSESDDGKMMFQPAVLKVKQGETIRLKFTNKGETDHEFVMDVHEGIMEHKALMEKFPEMEHADPNSIRLAPGARGEIVWTFANAGEFGFACLIPGHYDSGMKGDISVAH